MLLNDDTLSLCNVCYQQIPARVYAKKDNVFIEKECPLHGRFHAIVEKDVDFYIQFSQKRKDGGNKFYALIIPVTFRCNLNCSFCFAPFQGQEDMSLGDIEKVVRGFDGQGIFLSGGEPTERNDLALIIETVKKIKPVCGIVTNGLKLSDQSYLNSLVTAGLDYVFFSFDSFKETTYSQIKRSKNKQRDILSAKLRALENLKQANIMTVLSATIYPGLNDDELKDLFLFAIRNQSYIIELRFRSCVNLGKHTRWKECFISELLNKFCQQMGIVRKKVLQDHLSPDDHSVHHIMINVTGVLVGNRFYPIYTKNDGRRGFLFKMLFLIRLALTNSPMKIYQAIHQRSFFNMKRVRFIHWPTVHNVDLRQIDRGVAHLYGKNKILNFCHTIILYNKDVSNE